ncbi:MAG TPA: M42 family metallopeptidase [Ktedonobacteraceae bacterium]|nr:M42 family metallopeptidase [Ktedonobacteraceae bacterium]
MDESRVAFLRRMIASPSPSGFEQPVQQVIREEIQHYTDEVRTDVHGNVIAALNPTGQPRVMLTAHCDELGFLIRYIDEEGFLYFAPIGGYDPSTLPGERVHIHTATGPIPGIIGRQSIHLMEGEERGKAPKLSEMWIDIGVSNKAEALKLVAPGSIATRAAQLELLRENLVVSRALDNKSGIFTIVEAMRRLHEQREKLKASVYFVSAVQEEIGGRGVATSAYSVDPLIAIAVDTIWTSDHPQTSRQEIGEIKLNGGPALTIGGFVNPRVYQLLVNAANEAGIAYQLDPEAGATYSDNDPVRLTRAGVASALVNIPCRYMHTASEVVSLKDLDEIAELLSRFALSIDERTNVIP